MKDWELSLGFYVGILIGFRTYTHVDSIDYVLYLPFIDLCYTIYNE